MKKNIFVFTLLIELLTHFSTSALSIVYSFRIAQVTRRPILEKSEQKPNNISALLFDLFQKTHCFNIRENYAGGLLTHNYNFAQNYYLRTDFAVSHVNQTVNKVPNVNVIEPDDILFTLGRNFKVSPKSSVTPSVLFGIPTHSVFNLQRVGFGVGQVGIGAQIDGLYRLDKNIDFLWGGRYGYFLPRTAQYINGDCYKFTIGSIADLLVAFQTSNPLSHGIEAGYDARWGFGVKACPNNIPNLDLLNYMRHNFYLVYKYTFLGKRAAHRFLLNISYGFDVKPKAYGYDAVMLWAAWGVAF